MVEEACIRYCIQVLQRGATAEDVGERSVLGRPRRVLLGYTPCLGSATWEGGAAPGCGELQDPSPLRALLALKVRWGCSDWTEASGLGEGSRLEMSLESLQGERRKAKWGQMGHSRLRAGDCGPVGSNSEPERSGRQGLSSILLFLCKTTVSEFETLPGDVWGQCCHGFIKGVQGEHRTTAGPAHVLTGNESHQGSWAHRLEGTSVLRTGLPPSSHLLVRGPGTPILAPPPGPGFWDSLGVSKTLMLLYLPGDENVLNAAID